MPKPDPRLTDIGSLIKKGKIKTFSAIFNHIPPTVIADAMHWGHSRLGSVMERPGRLRLEEVYELARLFKIGKDKLFKMVMEEMKQAGYGWE